jgi:hypothetical protein
MSEYLHVEKPFLDQLASLGCAAIEKHGLMHDLLTGRVRVSIAAPVLESAHV